MTDASGPLDPGRGKLPRGRSGATASDPLDLDRCSLTVRCLLTILLHSFCVDRCNSPARFLCFLCLDRCGTIALLTVVMQPFYLDRSVLIWPHSFKCDASIRLQGFWRVGLSLSGIIPFRARSILVGEMQLEPSLMTVADSPCRVTCDV